MERASPGPRPPAADGPVYSHAAAQPADPVRPTDPQPSAPTSSALLALGLVEGDRVRWRAKPGGRWLEGRAVGRERDGSVGVRDGNGASRAITVDRLEVRAHGPRGGAVWEPLAVRAARTEQLGLFG